MYKAIMRFKDIDGTEYVKGDIYPQKKATKERIQQLLTSDNRLGKPVIVETDVAPPTEDRESKPPTRGRRAKATEEASE